MKMLASLPLLAAFGFTCGAHAEDAAKNAPSRSRACLFASQPQSWRVLDRQHLVLWGPSQKEAYLVTLFAPLDDINFSDTLAFIDGDHNGMICGDGADKIGVPSSAAAAFPVTITDMRQLDDADLVSLGAQYKVKLISDKKAQAVKDHDKQKHETASKDAQ